MGHRFTHSGCCAAKTAARSTSEASLSLLTPLRPASCSTAGITEARSAAAPRMSDFDGIDIFEHAHRALQPRNACTGVAPPFTYLPWKETSLGGPRGEHRRMLMRRRPEGSLQA
jgi:hypothetical protein